MKGLAVRRPQAVFAAPRKGFTLVELLVVIAIITVLIAIILPVYRSAREHTRQRMCMANLYQIATAIRMYRIEEGAYPGPYEPVTGEGGLNVLYPYYLDDRSALICPDDEIVSGDGYYRQYQQLLDAAGQMYVYNWQDPAFFSEHYSSYNGLYNWLGYVREEGQYNLCALGSQTMGPGDSLSWWYEWYRWDPDNRLGLRSNPADFNFVDAYLYYHLGQQVYWWNYLNDQNNMEDSTRLVDNLGRPLWDPGENGVRFPRQFQAVFLGAPSAIFPGLINRNAPDNTIVTRCPHHRAWTVVRIRREPGKRGLPGEEHGGMGIPDRGSVETQRDETPRDIVLRLNGHCTLVRGFGYDWARQPR